ncbi:MAG: nitroreductase [Muribaculaceae bacterium]|nr:nitroreductase [Muribaculaceae bacterium]
MTPTTFTDQQLLEAVPLRHSVRAYHDRPIEPEKAEALQALVEWCNTEGDLNLALYLNEPRAFSSPMARYGQFRNANNYFAIVGKKAPDFDERAGYYGERLVLAAQSLGLNTCWVGLSYSKRRSAVTLAPGEHLRAVISLGYGADEGRHHKIKTVEKVSRVKGEAPEWFVRGVECALLAPTAINQQKFTFILHDDDVVEARAGIGFYSRVDLGIVKLHFELAAAPHPFTWLDRQ